jgi:hypothetical protein
MRMRLGLLDSMIAASTLALLLTAACPARSSELGTDLAVQLAGKTLSAVAYTRVPPGPGGRLQRQMLQAYLAPDGSSLVRQWVGARNSYSAPARTRWWLAEDMLCIGLPQGPLCAKVHIWGPRIAGIGTLPYAMLDGDLQPGNAISRSR